MDVRRLFVISIAGLLATIGAVHAKDAVRSTVVDADGAVVVENGAFHVPGTYAVGTLKLHYFVSAFSFPAGSYASPEICFETMAANSRPVTSYPATMYLDQIGGEEILLGPSNPAPQFSDTGDEVCVIVDVSVPSHIALDPDYQQDGTELVANLRLSTPPRTHLDTVTLIKVHMTLVHPTDAACVRALHLVSNIDLDQSLSDLGIALSYNTANGNLAQAPVNSTHLLALVNSCTQAVTVDLNTAINVNYDLFQANAVRTTTSNQQFVDIDALLGAGLDLDSFVNQGQVLCLNNVSVPAEQSFVLSQRLSLKADGNFPGGIGNPVTRDLGAWEYDGFYYGAHDASGTCAALASLSDDVDPSQGAVTVPINQVSFSGPGAPATRFPPP